MPKRITPTVAVLSLVATFSLLIAVLPCTAGDKTLSDSYDLLTTLGEIGPGAVQLKVWTDKPPEYEFKTGDRIQIHFLADRDCYLAILNVSKSGNVVVLFPNRESRNNSVKGGVEYTLFGDDSSMKLVMAKGLSEATTVFYVSTEPFFLDTIKIPQDKAFISFSVEDDDWKVLANTMREVSKKPGYNRTLLSIKGKGVARDLKLMGPLHPKAAPRKSESEIPETVTGSQGLKPQADR
jgi:hypothetical protein